MRNQRNKISSANFKTIFNVIPENQLVVFTKQSVVFISNVKNKAKTNLKESSDRKINTKTLYWFTLYQELHAVLRNL